VFLLRNLIGDFSVTLQFWASVWLADFRETLSEETVISDLISLVLFHHWHQMSCEILRCMRDSLHLMLCHNVLHCDVQLLVVYLYSVHSAQTISCPIHGDRKKQRVKLRFYWTGTNQNEIIQTLWGTYILNFIKIRWIAPEMKHAKWTSIKSRVCTEAVWKFRGITLLFRLEILWRCGDGLFFEVSPLAGDAVLPTLHPLL
jgi:hypothetical protein